MRSAAPSSPGGWATDSAGLTSACRRPCAARPRRRSMPRWSPARAAARNRPGPMSWPTMTAGPGYQSAATAIKALRRAPSQVTPDRAEIPALVPSEQDAADEGGLAGVLQAVGDHADQPDAQRHGRVPGFIHDP